MDLTRLKEMIRVWAPIVGLAFAGYYAYDYYVVFQQDAGSPLNQKRSQQRDVKKENDALQKKLDELDAFARQVESKKIEVAGLAERLGEVRGALAEDVLMPDFVKLLVSEAKRVGLTVLSVTPSRKTEGEYYYEYPVELRFHGVYAQVFSFLSRLANLQRIVRVDRFDMKPTSSSASRYVELEGSLLVKTFAYMGSQADKIGKAEK